MVAGLFFVLTVGILWTMIGVIYSHLARNNVDFIGFMAFSSILTALCGWIMIPQHRLINAHALLQEQYPATLMLLAGLFQAVGMTTLQHAMKLGHHGAAWTMGQSALAIPCLLGVLIWGDRIPFLNAVGLVILLAAIVLFGLAGNNKEHRHRQGGAKWLILGLLAMLLLGIQQTLLTVPSRWIAWDDQVQLRVPMQATGSMIGFGILILALRRPVRWRDWRMAMIVGFITLASAKLLFHALDLFAIHSRVTLVFPLAIGTCTTLFSAYSLWALKERHTWRHSLGMGIGCLGIILVAF